jgi:membrane-associated phospholipid phosphatase
VGPDRGKSGLATWQKVVGIIGLLVILVIVIALLVGGGHTPPVQHGAG